MKGPSRQGLQEFYSRKGQEELLRLAADVSSLSEDARRVITAELQKRGFNDGDLRPYRQSAEQGERVATTSVFLVMGSSHRQEPTANSNRELTVATSSFVIPYFYRSILRCKCSG